MRIERVELLEVEAALRFRFETSFGEQRTLRKLLVVLHADGLEGLGEVTAGTVPGYSSETTATARVALREFILPRVLGEALETPAQLLQRVAGVRGHDMAVAAVETAFWDLRARALGVPLWHLLGGVRTAVPVGASIGIQPSVDETVAQARAHAEEGYRRLKFKIKPGWDVVPLRAVREALPDMPLTVDANSAYRLTDARALRELDALELDYLEQPLAHDDLHDHAALQGLLGTPLCLDESVHGPADARKGLASGAGRVINVKVGRVRGHLRARQVHDVAEAFGAPVWCGGMLELGVGRAHNLHLSTLPNFTLPGDTASASRYWARDVVREVLDAHDGIQPVPPGPGLGVTLDRDAVEEALSWRAEVAA